MQQTKLPLLRFFVVMMAGCSDNGHSHDDNSHNHTPSKHDLINLIRENL